MAIFKESESSLAVDADDPHTLNGELRRAIEIAELEAQLMGGAGVSITQHDYWSFTVTPTFEVPFGQRTEQRRWLTQAQGDGTGRSATSGHD
ncbi:hypothetical protein ABIE18_004342 [Arthrobacter sp. 2762]